MQTFRDQSHAYLIKAVAREKLRKELTRLVMGEANPSR